MTRLVLVLALLFAPAQPVAAQDDVDTEQAVEVQAQIDELAGRTQLALGNPETPTAVLNALREELVRARSAAHADELARAPTITDLRSRIDAIGPEPAETAPEAPEVARLRADLAAQLAAAQSPVLLAQEAARRASSLIAEVDRVIRARIAAQRFGHGPSPLLPPTWSIAALELGGHISAGLDPVYATLGDSEARRQVLHRLPLAMLLGLGAFLVAFTLRWHVGAWIESDLLVAIDRRVIGRLLLLRSLNRVVWPVIGASLLFASLDVAIFDGRPQAGDLLALLPAWVIALIAANWLAVAFFSPNAPTFRIAPLDTSLAQTASRLTLAAGAVMATRFLLEDVIVAWHLSLETRSVLAFPLAIAGAIVVWRAASVVDVIAARIVDDPPAAVLGGKPALPLGEQSGGRIAWWLLRLLSRALRVIAIISPPLAAFGYIGGADYFLFGGLLSLALLAGAIVLHDLLSRALASLLLDRPSEAEGGLIPVFVAMGVILACIPLFALAWGARAAEIRDVWSLLADGVAVGGITISINVLLTFMIAFAVVLTITRLLQSLLVSSVLPRTRLDTGAREAARAGVGYVGFALAVVAGIGAAGLDLSNLALVAGALSVGIGFGLQTVVSNFVSGIILLVERPIKPGDWIEVGGNAGYVRGIRVRSTEIETFDRASVIVPNAELITGTVLNRTHTGMTGRLQVMVGVTYDADPRLVERILLEIAQGHPLLLEEPAPAVLLTSLGPDSMEFELRGWLRDVNYSLSVRSDLNFRILEQLTAQGIRIQFYGRDLRPTPPPPDDSA